MPCGRAGNNLYWSLAGSAAAATGVILALAAGVVAVCHAFEAPMPETDLLRFSYVHVGMVVALASMVFGFAAIHATLKLNESVKLQEFHFLYAREDTLEAIRWIGDVARMWADGGVGDFGRPDFDARTPGANPTGPLSIRNLAALEGGGVRRRPWSEREDRARRVLKNHFLALHKLYETRSIGRRTLRDLCDNDAFVLLFSVVEPMEAIINDCYKWQPFRDLMRLCGDVWAECSRRAAAHRLQAVYWDRAAGRWGEPEKRP